MPLASRFTWASLMCQGISSIIRAIKFAQRQPVGEIAHRIAFGRFFAEVIVGGADAVERVAQKAQIEK